MHVCAFFAQMLECFGSRPPPIPPPCLLKPSYPSRFPDIWENQVNFFPAPSFSPPGRRGGVPPSERKTGAPSYPVPVQHCRPLQECVGRTTVDVGRVLAFPLTAVARAPEPPTSPPWHRIAGPANGTGVSSLTWYAVMVVFIALLLGLMAVVVERWRPGPPPYVVFSPLRDFFYLSSCLKYHPEEVVRVRCTG